MTNLASYPCQNINGSPDTFLNGNYKILSGENSVQNLIFNTKFYEILELLTVYLFWSNFHLPLGFFSPTQLRFYRTLLNVHRRFSEIVFHLLLFSFSPQLESSVFRCRSVLEIIVIISVTTSFKTKIRYIRTSVFESDWKKNKRQHVSFKNNWEGSCKYKLCKIERKYRPKVKSENK